MKFLNEEMITKEKIHAGIKRAAMATLLMLSTIQNAEAGMYNNQIIGTTNVIKQDNMVSSIIGPVNANDITFQEQKNITIKQIQKIKKINKSYTTEYFKEIKKNTEKKQPSDFYAYINALYEVENILANETVFGEYFFTNVDILNQLANKYPEIEAMERTQAENIELGEIDTTDNNPKLSDEDKAYFQSLEFN